MRDTTITLRNYRCFPESGASITIGNGLTALVGPNNSGKTSFIRMFYETRPLWSNLDNVGYVQAWFQGAAPGPGNPQGVHDPVEIFSDQNRRPLAIELNIAREQFIEFTHMRFWCERASPHLWKLEPLQDPGQPEFHRLSQVGVSDTKLLSTGTTVGDLSAMYELGRVLRDTQYFGPFRNAITEASASYFDLNIGTAFVGQWNDWKTGPNKAQNRVAEEVTETLRKIFGMRRLEINAAAGLKTLQVNVDGRPYKLSELGAGLAQFIVVFTNAALRRPALILIDEPELSLHPSLQVDFLLSLASYAKVGIVFATHSIGLARVVADRVYSLRRDGDTVVSSIFEQTPNYAEFVGEMSFSSFRELGFESILLVEGASDVRTVQQWLRLLEKEHAVVVIPLGGGQLIRPTSDVELAELKRISPRVSVLFDSERRAAGGGAAEGREAFGALCDRLGFRRCMTERRALENYLSDRAVKAEMGDKYTALGPFELLKEHQPGWGKAETWRIARQMTRDEMLATDVGTFLAEV